MKYKLKIHAHKSRTVSVCVSVSQSRAYIMHIIRVEVLQQMCVRVYVCGCGCVCACVCVCLCVCVCVCCQFIGCVFAAPCRFYVSFFSCSAYSADVDQKSGRLETILEKFMAFLIRHLLRKCHALVYTYRNC